MTVINDFEILFLYFVRYVLYPFPNVHSHLPVILTKKPLYKYFVVVILF